MSEHHTSKRRIEYIPPDAGTLRQYAREICDDLAVQGDESICDRDVVNGLTEFMLIAGRIQAKYLNRLASVDTPKDSQYGE